MFSWKINPFVYPNSAQGTPCTQFSNALGLSECTEYIRYGFWFEIATFVFAFFLCCLHFLNSRLFYCVFGCCVEKPEEEEEEPEEPSNKLLIVAKLKSVWFTCTVFACFSSYIRLYNDQDSFGFNSDYGLWTSGPLCKEQMPNAYGYEFGTLPTPYPNFGDCTVTLLSFITAMSVMAMCFAGLSFVCVVPMLKYPTTFKRVGLCFTGISTVCLVALASIWTTGAFSLTIIHPCCLTLDTRRTYHLNAPPHSPLPTLRAPSTTHRCRPRKIRPGLVRLPRCRKQHSRH